MAKCQGPQCTREPTVAVKTVDSRTGLTHTLYNEIDRAPKTASKYCTPCAMSLMVGLVRLSEADLDHPLAAELRALPDKHGSDFERVHSEADDILLKAAIDPVVRQTYMALTETTPWHSA